MRSSVIPRPPALTDGVITLRLRRAADVAVMDEAARDPETVRWLDDVPTAPGTPVDVEAALRRAADNFASGRAANLTIADAVADDPLGLLTIQFRHDDVATMAYTVFPSARGRGVAGRAVRLVLKWAFGSLGLSELQLEIDPENTASLRVAEKAGWMLRPEPNDNGERVYVLKASGAGRRGPAT